MSCPVTKLEVVFIWPATKRIGLQCLHTALTFSSAPSGMSKCLKTAAISQVVSVNWCQVTTLCQNYMTYTFYSVHMNCSQDLLRSEKILNLANNVFTL